MQHKSELGNVLKAKRKEVGLSQQEVAEALGYTTPQFISNWERGMSHPPVGTLKIIGKLYKTSPEELFDIMCREVALRIEIDLRKKFARNLR